jgi:hypothetical protein
VERQEEPFTPQTDNMSQTIALPSAYDSKPKDRRARQGVDDFGSRCTPGIGVASLASTGDLTVQLDQGTKVPSKRSGGSSLMQDIVTQKWGEAGGDKNTVLQGLC